MVIIFLPDSKGSGIKPEPVQSVGLAALLALSLTGCHGPSDGFWSGPVSIRGNGETFEIAVCRMNTVISGVLLETRTTGGEWVVAWEVDGGTREFARGEALEYAALREDFPNVGTSWAPELVVGGEVSVVIHTDDEDYTIGAGFSLDAETYDPSRWFHPDGTATDDPC